MQVCAGHEAGCEVGVHAMDSIFSNDNTDNVLLIDAKNAFNSVNGIAFILNVKILCHTIAKFVSNCYSSSSRKLIIGGGEIKYAIQKIISAL